MCCLLGVGAADSKVWGTVRCVTFSESGPQTLRPICAWVIAVQALPDKVAGSKSSGFGRTRLRCKLCSAQLHTVQTVTILPHHPCHSPLMVSLARTNNTVAGMANFTHVSGCTHSTVQHLVPTPGHCLETDAQVNCHGMKSISTTGL